MRMICFQLFMLFFIACSENKEVLSKVELIDVLQYNTELAMKKYPSHRTKFNPCRIDGYSYYIGKKYTNMVFMSWEGKCDICYDHKRVYDNLEKYGIITQIIDTNETKKISPIIDKEHSIVYKIRLTTKGRNFLVHEDSLSYLVKLQKTDSIEILKLNTEIKDTIIITYYVPTNEILSCLKLSCDSNSYTPNNFPLMFTNTIYKKNGKWILKYDL